MKKILKSIFRAIGYDLVRYRAEQDMGINAYVDMRKMISQNQPILFDVGANQGQTVSCFKNIFKNSIIHSFEPSPSTFKVLKQNTIDLEGVKVWNLGIGEKKETLELNENSQDEMSSFLELGKKGWGEVKKKTPVDVVSIDGFLLENDIKNIDVLKLDAQGFELEIFKGAQRSMLDGRIGLIYFEVTFIEMYQGLPPFTKLYDFCIKLGYELVSFYPIHYRKGMAAWTDVLFKHKDY